MGHPPIPAFIGHVVISASFDEPQCLYPRETRGRLADDALLSPKRRQAVLFGDVRWGGQSGELVLAPPFFAGGGPMGDHLEFCFRADGIYYAITIHAWSTLARVVATLKQWVGGNRQVDSRDDTFRSGPAPATSSPPYWTLHPNSDTPTATRARLLPLSRRLPRDDRLGDNGRLLRFDRNQVGAVSLTAEPSKALARRAEARGRIEALVSARSTEGSQRD